MQQRMEMNEHPLDLNSVRAFVRIADLGSFTRAAKAIGSTQSAVSSKLKRLESRLGYRLVNRTSRYVEISPHGIAFLERARELLEAHDRACMVVVGARQRMTIGISNHVAGPELPALIARMNAHDPQLLIEVRIGSSADLLQSFDRREIDTAILRLNFGRDDGTIIAEEAFGWFAAPQWTRLPDEPVPMVTMAEPCGVRMLSGQLLDEAGIPWTEAFVGGGVAAVAAAVTAGLGVAALAPRMLPLGAREVGRTLGLPDLPRLPIIVHSRPRDGRARDAVSALIAAFQGAVRHKSRFT